VTITQEILIQEVLEERDRQDRKWGVQRHAPETWMLITGEEFGEVSKAVLEWRWGASDVEIRKELIQLVACGLAFLESLQRMDHIQSMVTGADQTELTPAQGAENV
jgi:NTP pyrophosphatase (non-canonical NTP hydrolase)